MFAASLTADVSGILNAEELNLNAWRLVHFQVIIAVKYGMSLT